MSFQPIVPFGGLAGWKFLQRTQEVQRETHSQNTATQREIGYFKERITTIQSAEALVGDRTLRKIALGAFGLEADLDNTFFIRKILEDGTTNQEALSNRLSDKRYRAMSEAFGFGDPSIPGPLRVGFGEQIVQSYLDRSFETAVGNQNTNMRLALGLQRELPLLAANDSSNDTKWFSVMGQAPLRKVFEVALGLPDSFAALDLDRQLRTFKSRADIFFGSSDLSIFTNPEKLEDLTRQFFARASTGESSQLGNSRNSVALALLRSAPN